MIKFYLYRLKIDRPVQKDLLLDEDSRKPDEIIFSAIERKPSLKINKGPTWRIGNVQEIAKEKVFFALGKVTRATRELYDEERGDFVEEDFPNAPHTHVAIDLKLQVCAIAHKTKIASQVNILARNLEKLLNKSQETHSENLTFSLNKISDSEKFLELIQNAKRIANFEITLDRPNPMDVDKKFHKPMEEFVRAANAKDGKASVNSAKEETLDHKVIEEAARSVISAGGKARAKIQSEGEENPSTRRSDGDPLIVQVEEASGKEEKLNLFEKIKRAYHKVRKMEN